MEYAILIFAIVTLVALFVGSRALNEKAAIPEGCQEAYLEAQSCETCGTKTNSCGFKDALQFMEGFKEGKQL
ncbi:MAG: hypothetical protein IH571_01145 [Acholeplasmataceae bacterium]|nr:hypothetical protein [Acholeplasmataceae bacterium]